MSSIRVAFAVIACLAALPAAAQPTAAPPQTIALSSYAYAPAPILLAAGRPVTLTFVNRSGSGHDFTARQFFASSSILAGSAAGGEIELRPGESRAITLIPRAGTYPVHCGHFFHKQLGMRSRIVVR